MTDTDPSTLCALNSALLRQVGARMGFDLTPEAVHLFERYAALLVVWNQKFNLTRITRPDEIAIRHFLDSLVCLRGVPADKPNVRCIDVGAGAGLPGFALKFVHPDWSLTLVDSVGKKVGFMEHVVAELKLDGVTVVQARAEEIGQMAAHRGAYDVAVARAVGSLPVLAELLLPLLRVGGRMLALKGEAIESELDALRAVQRVLGGKLLDVSPYTLPATDGTRHLVVVEKVSPTPARYPRRPGVPEREPLARAFKE